MRWLLIATPLINRRMPKSKLNLLYARATFFIYLRRYDESIADLDAALKARAFDKEKEMQIRLFYGNLLFLQERYGEAALQFEKTLEKEDVSPLPRRLYANVLYKKGGHRVDKVS